MSQTPTPQPSTGPLSTEPVLTLTVIYGVIGALVILLAAFGLNISQDKVHAIEGFVGVVFPLVAALHIRSIVFSPHSVKNVEQGKTPGGG
jgi:hypothetical protein